MRRGLRFASVLACACALAACVSAPPDAKVRAGPAASQPSFAALVDSRRSAIVEISTLRIGRDQSEGAIHLQFAPESNFAERLASPLPARVRISEIRDLASGLILSSDGFVVTSAHVVSQIDEVQVRLHDGRRFVARVVGSDSQSDIALLRIDAEDLPVTRIGDPSTLSSGDWVAAIGAPFGFHGSVTSGVVSAKDRFIADGSGIPYIQTDVAINPGSSGSPLFNDQGEVVAINSMIYSNSGGYMGLSFAVPIDLVMRVAAQLRASGMVRRARLGAEFQEITPMLARSFELPHVKGALVVKVLPDSPAEQAGLKAGDVLSSVDSTAVSHHSQVLRLIAERPVGSRIRLEIWRGGFTRSVWVVLAEEPTQGLRRPGGLSADWNDGLGLRLAPVPERRRLELRIDGGLLVRESSGLARSDGVRAGDVVLALNARQLHSLQDFQRALSEVPAGQPVALLVMRKMQRAYISVRTTAQTANGLQ